LWIGARCRPDAVNRTPGQRPIACNPTGPAAWHDRIVPEIVPLDVERLAAYVTPTLGAGPLTATLIVGGKSNLTFRISRGGDSWVLRRPPLGHVLATAHDVHREFRVLTALAPTGFPVPSPILFCADETVLGAPFYLMEDVAGTIFRTAAELAILTPARGRQLSENLVDNLVRLHAIDTASVGLADFGRPEGFLQRQVRRWTTQFAGSRSRDIPGIDALIDDLSRNVPVSGPAALVHGDYKLDNVVVTGGERIVSVLDWEMSTLGDPLTDLGLMLVYWDGDQPNGPGFLTADDVVDRYAHGCGRDVSRIDWYHAFGYFKLAVIAEGIYFRHQQGLTVGAGFDDIGAQVFAAVNRAQEILEG